MEEQNSQQSVYQQHWIATESNGEPKQWLAIASFVLALLGFNILGLVFWIIALKRKQLRWAALAGTIISAVKLFFVIVILFVAIVPRLGVAQQRARDMARKTDLNTISTALMAYDQTLPEAQNWCTREIMNILIWNWLIESSIDDPLIYPFQPSLLCDSDQLWYWYWTNWTNFALSAAIEYPGYANLCKTISEDFVTKFKNALNQNDVEAANNILKNVWSSCAETGSSNLYYIVLY